MLEFFVRKTVDTSVNSVDKRIINIHTQISLKQQAIKTSRRFLATGNKEVGVQTIKPNPYRFHNATRYETSGNDKASVSKNVKSSDSIKGAIRSPSKSGN